MWDLCMIPIRNLDYTYFWGFMSSEMLHCVIKIRVSNFSNDFIALRVKEPKKKCVFGLFDATVNNKKVAAIISLNNIKYVICMVFHKI